MKKWLPFLAFFVLILGGCGFSAKNQKIERGEKIDEPISNLLEKKEEIECFVFDGDLTPRIRAKEGKIRIDGFVNSLNKNGIKKSSSFLDNGSVVFVWEVKNGLKYDKEKIKNLSLQGDEEAKKIEKAISVFEWVKAQESRKLKYSCKKASIPDDYFGVPREVNFVNFDEQAENINENKEAVSSQKVQDNKEVNEEEIIEDPEADQIQDLDVIQK